MSIKCLNLIDGIQLIGKVTQQDPFCIEKPHRLVMSYDMAKQSSTIGLERYPIKCKNDKVYIHKNVVVCITIPEDDLEQLYRTTTSPIDLVSKLSTGDRKAR